MSENVVINGTTYNGVDALALIRADGTVVTFYPDAVRYNAQTLTEAQKAQARLNLGVGSVDEVAAEVLARLGTPVFGTVDEENNIILSGNLAEGTYTLKYEDADGKITEIGTLNHSLVTYTNLFNPATASINTRMSGSSGTSKAQDGYVMTASISIPATAIKTTEDANTPYIVVPASMWSGSANVFFQDGNSNGYIDCNSTKGTVVGAWVKLPVKSQWTNTFTADRMVVSLYVKGSAITASDIQNIEIYFNEIPE